MVPTPLPHHHRPPGTVHARDGERHRRPPGGGRHRLVVQGAGVPQPGVGVRGPVVRGPRPPGRGEADRPDRHGGPRAEAASGRGRAAALGGRPFASAGRSSARSTTAPAAFGLTDLAAPVERDAVPFLARPGTVLASSGRLLSWLSVARPGLPSSCSWRSVGSQALWSGPEV